MHICRTQNGASNTSQLEGSLLIVNTIDAFKTKDKKQILDTLSKKVNYENVYMIVYTQHMCFLDSVHCMAEGVLGVLVCNDYGKQTAEYLRVRASK